MRTQSSHLPDLLPAWSLTLCLVAILTPALSAQQRYRVARSDAFRQDAGPDARQLATVAAGAEVTGDDPRNGWVEVELEGWIWSASVARTNRDGHNLSVTASRGENLRAAPNGAVIARLLSGFLLDEVRRDGAWVRARRSGWMAALSLAAVPPSRPDGQVAGRPPAASVVLPAPEPSDGGAALDRAVVARATQLAHTPDGESAGSLAPNVPVRILARSGSWVRVQTDGWVREGDLRPGAPGVIAGLTAAELRSRPQEYEGKLVQWTLQFLSVATADELRPEIPAGHRYLLARGPLPEAGFVYVAFSASQLRDVERLPPLAQIVVVARVKNGRSKYLGNPVLDLVEIQVRQP